MNHITLTLTAAELKALTALVSNSNHVDILTAMFPGASEKRTALRTIGKVHAAGQQMRQRRSPASRATAS